MSGDLTQPRYASQAIREQAEMEQAATAAAMDVARKAKAAHLEQELHDRFIRSGGTEAEWTLEKHAILSEARKQAALDKQDAARARMASLYRNF